MKGDEAYVGSFLLGVRQAIQQIRPARSIVHGVRDLHPAWGLT